MIVTTTPSVEGKRITKYHGVIGLYDVSSGT